MRRSPRQLTRSNKSTELNFRAFRFGGAASESFAGEPPVWCRLAFPFRAPDVVARNIRQRIDIFSELDLPHDVMLIERLARTAKIQFPHPAALALGDPLCRFRAWHLVTTSAGEFFRPLYEAVQSPAGEVLITIRRSSPDSGSQTSPARPRIWRTPAPFSEEG
jgi:hypothetical protein